MTLEQTMKERLMARGMWPMDADTVMALAKQDEALTDAGVKWDDVAEGYPPQFYNVLWYSVRELALAFIDANTPKAFYRPLFVA